ncbi:DNRLRE domain-containing protein [Mucilaginibacter ginsenosidivorax]|uniref:DNRLRE domain-containing protein n=1 Tax=Mucilaginibacter ginsenosidivorax TaxID=862126 RepID=A0A5B8W0P7_9SPHI|nr:DNRLRE domain-containing protein [Mucilaginibacter ginsenosidivorax]QEC75788.1 DNRLRE domain-containing protein [Mucilaginibacter ginsenosidivorax]
MKTHKLIPVTGLIVFFALAACQKNTVTPTVQKVVAKAEPDVTITLPKDSVLLTGTDGNPADVAVGYLWSQISGPGEASIVNESSASATAKHLVEGKYLFQFMVIDNNGLSGVDTVGVIVKGPTITTLDLSPTNNPNETNVGIYNGQDASNHTSIEEPLCAWTINFIPITVRNLLKFDLSSIPANATITSAQLYLYSDTIPKNGDLVHANSGTDNSFVVQQVATDWSTASVTWFNQPAGLTANQVILPSTNQPFLNMNINVKDMVSSMVSSNANYGFKLFVQNEVLYTCRIFCSSYYSDPSRHPRLIVKYIKH